MTILSIVEKRIKKTFALESVINTQFTINYLTDEIEISARGLNKKKEEKSLSSVIKGLENHSALVDILRGKIKSAVKFDELDLIIFKIEYGEKTVTSAVVLFRLDNKKYKTTIESLTL